MNDLICSLLIVNPFCTIKGSKSEKVLSSRTVFWGKSGRGLPQSKTWRRLFHEADGSGRFCFAEPRWAGSAKRSQATARNFSSGDSQVNTVVHRRS
jgi:hypothetical protein